MAKGYKRDSRGRFAGGYGAGALGGKGAYAARPNSGKGSRGSRGGTAKIQQPRAVRAKKIGRSAANLMLGPKGSMQRKQVLGGAGLIAAGQVLGSSGLRTKNDNRLVAGLALGMIGSVAVRTSGLASTTPRSTTGKKVRR